MKSNTFNKIRMARLLLICSGWPCFVCSTAYAEPLMPMPAVGGNTGGQLLPGQRCMVEALNVGGIVNPDGRMFVPNLPTTQGAIRLRATCIDALGTSVSGQSAAVVPTPGGVMNAGNIDFGTSVSIPAKLTLAPLRLNLTGVGQTQQLAVGSAFADQSTRDVTASSTGTTYRSSNLAVATVGPNGQVTAVGAGTAILSALNDGTMGLATVTVRSASLTSLDVIPASVAITLNPIFPASPVLLQTSGLLSDGKILDLTAASSGTAYSSSAPSVAAVDPDGRITAVAPGAATITVLDGQSGLTEQIPVLVTAFSPAPFAAYNTPGFAHNVDISGTLAFVADDTAGLQILDTASGAVVGALSFAGQPAMDVRLRGTLAAVALGAGGFNLVDVTTPSQPSTLSHTATAGSVRDLWISGTRLYAASSNGVLIYDISNPAVPTPAGSLLGFTATAVAADSARGVVVALTNQPAVQVIRAVGPGSWATVTLPLPPAINQAHDVVLFGTRAYVANGRDGLHEVDITDLTNPVLTASSTLSFDALGVATRTTEQGTIVAAADDLFVNAVPLFNPALINTFNVDFSAFPGILQWDANSTGIALGEGFGVITVGSSGIQVFRTQQLTDNYGVPPTVSLTQPTNGGHILASGLTATATDDVYVSFVEFLVDGIVAATDSSPPFSAAMTVGAPCSTHVLQARATDLAGNEGTSLAVSAQVLCADGQPCAAAADCASSICTGGVCQSCANGATTYFADDFSDNSQGWVLGPEWQIGSATVSSGGVLGADPAVDHTATTDNGVAGVVIGGNATQVLHPYYYLESPPFTTANAAGPVILGFYRWLNSDYDPYMHNSIDVWNGATWVNLWTSGPSPGIQDSPPAGMGWTFIQHDITAYKNATMRIRFGFNITSGGVWTIGSWNIDDVLVAAAACP